MVIEDQQVIQVPKVIEDLKVLLLRKDKKVLPVLKVTLVLEVIKVIEDHKDHKDNKVLEE